MLIRLGGVPHLRPGGGTPSQVGGVPHPRSGGVPHPRSRGGTPSQVWGYLGYPPSSRPGWGTPTLDLRWGTPSPYLRWGTPLPSRPGWGTPPPVLARVPPYLRPEMGYPPPPRKCEQTENITFPHPSDAGGNNISTEYCIIVSPVGIFGGGNI